MPTYKVKDNYTGKVVTYTGDQFPNDAQAETAFRQAGLHQDAPQGMYQPPASVLPQGEHIPGRSLTGDIGTVAKGVKGDISGLIGDLTNLPGNLFKGYWQGVAQGQSPEAMLGHGAYNVAKGYAGNLYKDIGSPLQGGDVVARAYQNLLEHPVNTALDVLPALGVAKKIGLASKTGKAPQVLSTTAKMVTRPHKFFGNVATQAAKDMGEIPSTDLLTQKFGTVTSPNLDLVKGLGTAKQEKALINVLKGEIQRQSKTSSEVLGAKPLWKDLLDWKRGTQNAAYTPNIPKGEVDLYKRIAHNYRQILHENIPQVAKADDINTLLYHLGKLSPKLAKKGSIGVGSAVGIGLLWKILTGGANASADLSGSTGQ